MPTIVNKKKNGKKEKKPPPYAYPIVAISFTPQITYYSKTSWNLFLTCTSVVASVDLLYVYLHHKSSRQEGLPIETHCYIKKLVLYLLGRSLTSVHA